MMLIPGPVEVPDSVLRASAYVQNHRSAEFRKIVKDSEEILNRISGSKHTVMTTGSGTSAVESMIYSFISPGERVAAVTFGEFGNRAIESLQRRGAIIHVMKKEENGIIAKGELEDFVGRNPGTKTVFLIHNETGNGTAIRNLREVAQEANGLGVKVLVDSVSGFGGSEIYTDKWGIHAFASCSQKGLASVPGVGIVCIGEEGESRMVKVHDLPVYIDLRTSLEYLKKNETPFTPSTGSFRAIHAALRILEKEGLENRWKRHTDAASFMRNFMRKNGFGVIGQEGNYSDTVVAVEPGMPVDDLVKKLAEKGIVISKGMGKDSSRFVRIGNMGIVDNIKVAAFLNAFSQISGLGVEVNPGDLPKSTGIDREILQMDF